MAILPESKFGWDNYYNNPTVLINGSDVFNGTDINATAKVILQYLGLPSPRTNRVLRAWICGRSGSHVDAVGGNAQGLESNCT